MTTQSRNYHITYAITGSPARFTMLVNPNDASHELAEILKERHAATNRSDTAFFATMPEYYRHPRSLYGEIKNRMVEFNSAPTHGELLAHLREWKTAYDEISARIEIEKTEYNAAQKAKHEAKAKAKAEREAAARTIEFDDDGEALINVYERLRTLSRHEIDIRFQHWIKHVTGIDRSHNNGYMFEGSFVKDETIEITRDFRAVYIIATTTGSRRNKTTHYEIAVLENGTITMTEIQDTSETGGWSLRIRKPVQKLLDA